MKLLQIVLLFSILMACTPEAHRKEDHQIIEVKKTDRAPTIDGKALENSWNLTNWHPLDQNWLGAPYEHNDFNGRYKITWNENALYLLLEIIDDSLYSRAKDPLKLWWNNDSVQVFIDEDNSGGLHQYSHNAFAYNISAEGNIVDIAPNKEAKLYNHHIKVKKVVENKTNTWEMSVKLFNEHYQDGKTQNHVTLRKNKKIGFAVAYCDNDGSTERENFIGSVFIPGEDKNQAWIDADVLGTLFLIE